MGAPAGGTGEGARIDKCAVRLTSMASSLSRRERLFTIMDLGKPNRELAFGSLRLAGGLLFDAPEAD